MNNPEKFLKMLSSLIEAGGLTSQDLAKGLLSSTKFNKDKLAGKFDLATKSELDVLKKIVEKQQKEINTLKKKKKSKR